MGAHRRFPKGDRRLRLFPLPFGRSRRSEIPANHYSRYCTAISSRIAADSMMCPRFIRIFAVRGKVISAQIPSASAAAPQKISHQEDMPRQKSADAL